MKKIDHSTFLLSDGSIANVNIDHTFLFTNTKYWKTKKIKLIMKREQALKVLKEIDNNI